MSIGIWENLDFNLNDFKCIHKGFLRVEDGNFLLYRDDEEKLKLKVEGVMSQGLDFQERSGCIDKNESLIIFEHKFLKQKILMYALPIKQTHSLVGDNPKYTDIFIVDEIVFEDSHELRGVEYLIEFVDNFKVNHIFPYSIQWKEEHKRIYKLDGVDHELVKTLINNEHLPRNSIKFKIEEDEILIIKINDGNKGIITYKRDVELEKRDKIRKIISYLLGCPLIFYGYTLVNKYMTPHSSYIKNINDNERGQLSINFQLPSPLSLQASNIIESNLFQKLIQEFYVKYIDYDLGNILFTYWIAVNSNSITAAVHYGALIEKLQARYMGINKVSYSKILDKSVFKQLRRQLELQIEDFELTDEQKRIFFNKIGNMNTYSQKDKMDFFCNDISLLLSDIEKLAWQQRNDAAHGNDICDVNQAWKNTLILRELVNKFLLKLLSSSALYLSYLDGNPIIKRI
ncbi:hypothetical protein F994_02357 [Acinetobacter bohemicus ANC 3994]|uniref:ApeA N-terminal domain-containing protein n=1 Tax=Acinetobacter bohemicus ANC 3994 TaxID=1217715 RepID=N8QC91_9GAMM|nr:hypothetical protein [Acinetobacter bohemicus]ENU19497.1 hypothetical protein F994_02357 [Acinetobacter bohemicus ANC 3994]